MISEKKVIIFLAVTCDATRDQYEQIPEAVVPRNYSTFLLCQPTKKFGKHW